jgi:hypothetical protein
VTVGGWVGGQPGVKHGAVLVICGFVKSTWVLAGVNQDELLCDVNRGGYCFV